MRDDKTISKHNVVMTIVESFVNSSDFKEQDFLVVIRDLIPGIGIHQETAIAAIDNAIKALNDDDK